jgi:hypothetical protein
MRSPLLLKSDSETGIEVTVSFFPIFDGVNSEIE